MTTFYHEGIPNTSGIYRITCTVTGKIYIGSAMNLRKRRKDHFFYLQRNQHKNPKLQAAWNKYGEQDFLFEVVELVLIPEMLTAREQYWLDTLKPTFNILKVAGSSLGRVVPQSSREKSRATQLGRPSTRIGWKPAPEQVERHRQAILGKKQTEEHRRNAAATRVGKKRSHATREKMRLTALGHAPTNARTALLLSPDGTEYTVYNVAEFCREHGLKSAGMANAATGKRKQYRGWKARYLD